MSGTSPRRRDRWMRGASWANRISTLLAQRRWRKALNELDKVIHSQQLDLFADAQEDRRLAWLYRIDLLRDLGRHHEALAWACLECDLNPGNPVAVAVREELKAVLGYFQPLGGIGALPAPTAGTQWEGVAGMRELKVTLERDLIQPLRNPALYQRYGLTLPNGILLHGPPGCGKTHIARALSRVVDYDFIEVQPSDLASIYVHGTQQKIGELFEEAERRAPCILFLDELDAFVPNRGDSGVGFHYSAEVNEFLVRVNKCSERGILVIGATNRIESLDPALLRPGRLDKKVWVGPPDPEARAEVFRLYLQNRPVAADVNVRHLVHGSAWYTYAEIEHVVNEAARYALAGMVEISQELLLQALRDNPPGFDPTGSEPYSPDAPDGPP